MKGGIDIYYDEEGDFLEITVTPVPEQSYCEDIDEDVFVRKDSNTNEIVGIGILNFKTHTDDLKETLSKVPIKINFETIS
jgi:uncharacterized protein YuzE